MMGHFREGPTKQVDSVGMMASVAERVNRIFVEPCYELGGRLSPRKGAVSEIPFCTVFECGDEVMRFSSLQRRPFSNRTWVATRDWGFHAQGKVCAAGQLA